MLGLPSGAMGRITGLQIAGWQYAASGMTPIVLASVTPRGLRSFGSR
jgi:hypothetical protein